MKQFQTPIERSWKEEKPIPLVHKQITTHFIYHYNVYRSSIEWRKSLKRIPEHYMYSKPFKHDMAYLVCILCWVEIYFEQSLEFQQKQFELDNFKIMDILIVNILLCLMAVFLNRQFYLILVLSQPMEFRHLRVTS